MARVLDEYSPSVTPTAVLDAADFADYVDSYVPPRNRVRLLLGENVSRPLHQAIKAFVLGMRSSTCWIML